MARTMMIENNISHKFWKEAVGTTVHIQNRCLFRPHTHKISYELWFGRKPTVKYFKMFGSKCFIRKKNINLEKFEDKADEGIFLGYSTKSRGYKCYNKKLKKIVESTDVKVAEHGVYASDDGSNVEDIEIDESQMQEQNDVSPEFVKQSAADDSSSEIDTRQRNTVFHKDHP